MSHISANVRLRPVRFGFLVRPDDAKRTFEIFRINTSLWGGQFNPIIPYIKQIPKWWNRYNHRFESATQIVNGYFDFFEPDFIVEAEPGLSKGFGFSSDRILQLSDLIAHERDNIRAGYGLSVMGLYRDLFRNNFQFVRRHVSKIINVSPKENQFKAFCACVFGSLPIDGGLEYLAQMFDETFEPKQIALDGASLAELYGTSYVSVLRIGRENLKVDYTGHHWPALFVLDAKKPRDLIDFWNLRASRPSVIAIPIQWAEELSAFCKDYIVKHHAPLPGNPNGVMIHATVMFSRSIPTDEIESIHQKYFLVDKDGANVRQDWYPTIWRPSPNYTVRHTRPLLTAEENTFDR
jgi:hypothetical protein